MVSGKATDIHSPPLDKKRKFSRSLSFRTSKYALTGSKIHSLYLLNVDKITYFSRQLAIFVDMVKIPASILPSLVKCERDSLDSRDLRSKLLIFTMLYNFDFFHCSVTVLQEYFLQA